VDPNTKYIVVVGKGGDSQGVRNGEASQITNIVGFAKAEGGKGGASCTTLECVTNNPAAGADNGAGGVGGNPVGIFGISVASGQRGGDYNQVFNKWYHPPETNSSTDQSDYWIVEFAGGIGGSAGGSGGRGANCDREGSLTSSTDATAPGGGGAGIKGAYTTDPALVPSFSEGAAGRVIIWY
jgi:hypothetical protein